MTRNSPLLSRSLGIVVLTLLATVLTGDLVASAQSEEEVARARDAADAATHARAEADAGLERGTAALISAVARYEQVTAELTDLGFAIGDAIDDTRQAEAQISARRAAIRRSIRTAYMTGAGSSLNALFSTSSLSDAILARAVAARSAVVDTSLIHSLHLTRGRLMERRTELESLSERSRILHSEENVLVNQLQELVTEARVRQAFAVADEEAAIEEYRLAEERLEAALRLVSPRALRWRPLVERYFDEHLVWAALQVLDCESRGDPGAVNPDSGATGLFQFLGGTWILASHGAGFPGASREDPEASVASAAWLVRHSVALGHPRGTWGHWSCQPITPDSKATRGARAP